jgi:transposase
MDETQTTNLKTYLKHAADGSAAKRAMAVLLLEADSDVTLTGYTAKHAERLRRDFKRSGTAVFEDKRKSNRERVLTRAERTDVIAALQGKQPKDVIDSCGDEHWSTYWLGRYIETLTGKQYKSKTSHHLLFREAKLSFHLPGRRYEKADAEKTDAWVKRQSDGRSRLMRAWNDSETVVFCEDEMVLTSGTTLQKVWLPQGQYPPVIETNSTRKRKSFYGFLNLKTGKEHTFVTDWQNMYITVEVLNQLRQAYPTQQLLIVWDNCGWHRGSEVMKWVRRDKHTKLLFFPAYAPELNPQEHVWKTGRKAVTHNKYITDIEQAAKDFATHTTNRTFSYGLCGLRPHPVAQV